MSGELDQCQERTQDEAKLLGRLMGKIVIALLIALLFLTDTHVSISQNRGIPIFPQTE